MTSFPFPEHTLDSAPDGSRRIMAAVQEFTLDVIAAAGAVSEESLRAFLGHGYTAQNALEVVLGIGAYTMSTLANRMTRAPLDEELRAFAWEEPAAVT